MTIYVFIAIVEKIVVVGIGMYRFKALPRPYKLVLYLVAIALFCECYGYYIYRVLKEHNVWLFNIYMPVETWLMGLAAIMLTNQKKIRMLFFLLLFISLIAWTGNIYLRSLYEFASTAMVFSMLTLTIIYIILLFNNVLFSSKKAIVHPDFWLALSTILYCACDTPYMGLFNRFSDYINLSTSEMAMINVILDILRYPIVAISFILVARQKQIVSEKA